MVVAVGEHRDRLGPEVENVGLVRGGRGDVEALDTVHGLDLHVLGPLVVRALERGRSVVLRPSTDVTPFGSVMVSAPGSAAPSRR